MSTMRLQVLAVVIVIWWSPSLSFTSSDVDEETIKHRASEVLAYILPANRTTFYQSCFGTAFLCGTGSFGQKPGLYQWRENISTIEEGRFWQTYKCVAKLKLNLCPVEGKWSIWTEWSNCSAPCQDTGERSRMRECNNPLPMFHGKLCMGFAKDVETCQRSCFSSSAKKGFRESKEYLQTIHKIFPQLEADCLHGHCDYEEVSRFLDNARRDRYWSHLICYKFKRACPVDGGWSDWGEWSNCSVSCGNGVEYRQRTCTSPVPASGGLLCEGKSTEERHCVSKNCPHISGDERAVFTEWSDFSPCSVSCGKYGVQETKRTCLMAKTCMVNNDVVNTLTMTKPCYRGACPERGDWSEWSEWTECSAIRGNGRRTRLHMCTQSNPLGGAYCLGSWVDTKDCTVNATSIRLSLAQNTSANDNGATSQSVTVAKGSPFDIPYDSSKEHMYEEWVEWTSCSQSCGGGYRTRVRNCKAAKALEETCEGEVRQIEFCNVFLCPANGGWSDWMEWSVCSTTCDSGFRHRYRRCDNPLATNGGICPGESETAQGCNAGACVYRDNHWSDWTSWSTCSRSCGGGEKTRSRELIGKDNKKVDSETMTGLCNRHPCAEDGNWAAWGEWTTCSTRCNLGHYFRDRTCTDPAPLNNGQSCPGPGSETAYCYQGPCGEDEPSIILSGQSYLTYSAHAKHFRYLVMYLRFRAESPGSTLFYRHRACKEETWECKHVISLTINEEWRPELTISIEGEGDGEDLKVSAKDVLIDSDWNDLLVGVSRKSAYIRVNDGTHTTAVFNPPLNQGVDFDANMILGAEKNGSRGFSGVISIMRVNFKEQALMQSPYWLGAGAPDKLVLITQYNDTEFKANYPYFRGNHYARLNVKNSNTLKIMLTLRLLSANGLILYNEGLVSGAFVALSVHEGGLKICFTCGADEPNCQEANILQLDNWYYLTLKVDASQASLRVNRQGAVQITCLGRRFRPQGEVFLGGAPMMKWNDIKYVTDVKHGLGGIVDVLVVNGEKFSFKRGGLLNFEDTLNSMGYSLSAHISAIAEHTESKVTLRCDYTDFCTENHQAKAIWLIGDKKINITNDVIVTPHLPGNREESSLTLIHQEGLYSCLVNQDGRLIITHTFPLYRVNPPFTFRASTEWSIIIALVVLVVCVLIATIAILVLKRDTLRHFEKSNHESRYLEDSWEEPEVVDMCDLSIVREEGEISDDDEEQPSDEEVQHSYNVNDINLSGSEDEQGETEEDDENVKDAPSQDEITRLGSAVAAKLIEENKDKVLELIASLGNMESFHQVSSRLSQRLSASTAAQLREASSGQTPQSPLSQHNMNASAVRMSSKTTAGRSYPSSVKSQDMSFSTSTSASSSHEIRRSISRRSSGSTSPARRLPINLSGKSAGSTSDIDPDKSQPHSSVETRRSISRRSSESPSPSRRGSALQPGSPRSLSMSISTDVQVPVHIQGPVGTKVLPNTSHSDHYQLHLTDSDIKTQESFQMGPRGPGVYPMRPLGLVRPPAQGGTDYSKHALGLSGPPRQPFGAIPLSEIKTKMAGHSIEPVPDHPLPSITSIAAPVSTAEPSVSTPEPPVSTAEPPVLTTEPADSTPEPPVFTHEAPTGPPHPPL